MVTGGDMVGVHSDSAQECAQPTGVHGRGFDSPRATKVAARGDRSRRYVNA